LLVLRGATGLVMPNNVKKRGTYVKRMAFEATLTTKETDATAKREFNITT